MRVRKHIHEASYIILIGHLSFLKEIHSRPLPQISTHSLPHPEVECIQSMENLCNTCRNLEVDNIFSTDRYTQTRTELHTNFNSLKASAQNGCPFCDLVSKTFLSEFDAKQLEEFINDEIYLGMPACPRSTRLAQNPSNSELWIWFRDREPFMQHSNRNSIRFSLNIARSAEEIRTGMP